MQQKANGGHLSVMCCRWVTLPEPAVQRSAVRLVCGAYTLPPSWSSLIGPAGLSSGRGGRLGGYGACYGGLYFVILAVRKDDFLGVILITN